LGKCKELDLFGYLLDLFWEKLNDGGNMKYRCKILSLSTALFLAVLIFGAEKGDAAKGKALFAKRCSACHGDSGEGKEAIAKVLNVKMMSLSSKEVQSLNDATLQKFILEGKGKMKPAQLSESETDDLIAFLRTLKK
jgi:mono/diheme cytochrome c family protein